MYSKTGLSPTAAFAGLALPVIMDSGRVVAALPFAAVRLAGFRPASLEVLLVLRAGMVVTCNVEVYRPNLVIGSFCLSPVERKCAACHAASFLT